MDEYASNAVNSMVLGAQIKPNRETKQQVWTVVWLDPYALLRLWRRRSQARVVLLRERLGRWGNLPLLLGTVQDDSKACRAAAAAIVT